MHILILSLVFSSRPVSSAAPSDTTAWRADQLYIVIFSLGPSWDHSKQAHEQSGFAAHSKNLSRLREEKRAIVGARYSDKGMIILGSESEESAREQFENDPMIDGGQFLLELHRLTPFYDGFVPK